MKRSTRGRKCKTQDTVLQKRKMGSPLLGDEWEIKQRRCSTFDEIYEYNGRRYSGATPSTGGNLCLYIGLATQRTSDVNGGLLLRNPIPARFGSI